MNMCKFSDYQYCTNAFGGREISVPIPSVWQEVFPRVLWGRVADTGLLGRRRQTWKSDLCCGIHTTLTSMTL